jgi:hypothetical protein
VDGDGVAGNAGCRGVVTGGARLRGASMAPKRALAQMGSCGPIWACAGLAPRSRQLGPGSVEEWLQGGPPLAAAVARVVALVRQ